MGRYHNALLLGDATERLSVLEASGNLPLAYMSAKVHGLTDDAERIKIAIETNEGEEKMQLVLDQTSAIETKDDATGGRLLQPPTPIFRQQNWPTLAVEKSTLADLTAAEPEAEEVETQAALNAPVSDLANDWQDAAMEADGFGDDLAGAVAGGDELDFGDDDWGEDDVLGDLGDLGDDDVDCPSRGWLGYDRRRLGISVTTFWPSTCSLLGGKLFPCRRSCWCRCNVLCVAIAQSSNCSC